MAKKASLELSINAIVIVVMAFVMLGLGLGFIRNQFKDIGSTTSQVQEQVKSQILDDLRTGNKKLSFPTTEVKMGTDESSVIAFGVKNTKDSSLKFCVVIEDLSKLPDDADECSSPLENSNKANGDYCGGFNWDYTIQALDAGESAVIGLKFFAPARKLTYLYKLKIISVADDSDGICEDTIVDAGEEYSSKTFFANIV
ncbi:MAG: hypothetical protein KKE20_06525 [Nanoarchaeota archaeon]|nr:hypothetical protein [Nanoarchaeota archaeon]